MPPARIFPCLTFAGTRVPEKIPRLLFRPRYSVWARPPCGLRVPPVPRRTAIPFFSKKTMAFVTETQTLRLELPPEGLALENGGALKQIDVAYEMCGTLNAARDNVVFICHALTGDAHVAGEHADARRTPGWWDNMVRDGGGIDTRRYFIICANILGGCMGTTGPSSIDPETGVPYGGRFPQITVRDIVEVHRRLLLQLGFPHVYAIIGGSFGGMQALEWSVRYPDFADKIAVIASGASLTPQALAFDIVGRDAIENDPNFNDGNYYGRVHPDLGLSLARKLAHITYISNNLMEKKFARRRREIGATGDDEEAKSIFEVESYLEHQGKKFINRFDANSYLRITEAMDNYDLQLGFTSLADSLSRIRAKVLVVSLSGDWLFLPEQSEALATALHKTKRQVSHFVLEAPAGHDAFLTHIEELSQVLNGFLVNHPVRTLEGVDEDHIRDYQELAAMIPEGCKTVLDLACGNGALLNFLSRERSDLDCTGVDIDTQRACDVLAAGHNAIRADVDSGLEGIPDNTYDCAILSESLQVMRRPDKVLLELLRIAPVGIVSFPNFGMWKVRAEVAFFGRMPVTKRLPWEWYNTPNIHLCTIRDFLRLCKDKGIKVDRIRYMSTLFLSKVFNVIGCKNLGASRVLVRIHR